MSESLKDKFEKKSGQAEKEVVNQLNTNKNYVRSLFDDFFGSGKATLIFIKGISILLVLLIVVVVLIITVRTFHLLAPPDFLWLSERSISTIDKMLNYVLFGSGTTQLLRLLVQSYGRDNDSEPR